MIERKVAATDLLLELLDDEEYFLLGSEQLITPSLNFKNYGTCPRTNIEIMRETIEGVRALLDVDDETLRLFIEANTRPYDLRDLGNWPSQYVFIEHEKFWGLYSSPCHPWEFEFRKQFPNSRGLLSVAMPGINCSGQEAIIFSSQVTSNSSSDCKFSVLKVVGNRWKCVGGSLTCR